MNIDQATATTSQVINFAEKTSKGRRSRRPVKRPAHPDAELIEHCIEYAAQIKAAELAHQIDPTDSKFAVLFDDIAQDRAERAMRNVMQTPPATMDGLRAKANIVGICIENWNGILEPLQHNFLISLAEDISRFQRISMALGQSDTVVEAST